MRLAGVGEAGQKRLADARVVILADGFVGDVAIRYLAGAGIGHICVKTPALASVARGVDPTVQVALDPGLGVGVALAPFALRRPAAAELAAGAHLALEILRKELQEPK
jgi:hypothetical protein